MNGSLNKFNPYIYLNALKDPESEDLETEQMITIRDLTNFLASQHVTYDPRALEYFFTFYAKGPFIRLDQLITIFVPNARLKEAKSSSYSNLILESPPLDKLRLVTSILLAELVFANTAITLYIEELSNSKPSIIDAYFDGQIPFGERLLKLYSSRTGDLDLPETLSAMAERFGRSSIEPKLISNAFRISNIAVVKKSTNENPMPFSSMPSFRDPISIDPDHKLLKPAFEGRQIGESELDQLPSILIGPQQFISFDHRKQQEVSDRILLSNSNLQVLGQPPALSYRKLKPVENEPRANSPYRMNKDSFRFIANPKYDDKQTDLSYTDVGMPMDSFKIIPDVLKKETSSMKTNTVPLGAKAVTANSNAILPPTISVTNSNSKSEFEDKSLPEKKLTFKNPNFIGNSKPLLDIENTNEIEQKQINSPTHRNNKQDNPQKLGMKSTTPNLVRDSRHNIPMKEPRSSKVFVSKANLNVSVNDSRLFNMSGALPNLNKPKPSSPVRVRNNMSPSPARKSVSHISTQNVSPSKRGSMILPSSRANERSLSKSPSAIPKVTAPVKSSNKLHSSGILPKSQTNLPSTQAPSKPVTPLPKPRESTPSITKVSATSTKTAPTPDKVKATPRSSVNIQSTKNAPPLKRGSAMTNVPSKSPVKPAMPSTKAPPKTVGKLVVSEKASTTKPVQKPQSSHTNLIEVQQKVVKQGSVVTSSMTLVRKETEPSSNLPIKLTKADSKLNTKRNTVVPDDIAKNLIQIDEEKRNSSLRSIDISAISNFERKGLKSSKIMQENSVEKNDYDSHMLLKNLEEFEKNNDFEHRNRFQSLYLPPPTIDSTVNKSANDLNIPMFTDNSLRDMLKIDTAPATNNNNSLIDDQSVQHDNFTPNRKGQGYFYDDEVRFKTIEDSKASGKYPTSESRPHKPSFTNECQDFELYSQSKVASNRANNNSLGMLLQPKTSNAMSDQQNTADATADLINKKDSARTSESLPPYFPIKNFTSFSSSSIRVVHGIITDIVARAIESIDEPLIRFNSNCSNNEEMSQLLAKYTDTSFTQNFNKIYSNANLSSDYINTSFRKTSQVTKRENLDQSMQKPLTSTTQIFDNLHFNYLNNFTDTRSNFTDTRNNLSLKNTLARPENMDSFSPYITTPDENATKKFFPSPEVKPSPTENQSLEKFSSFTNKHNVFLDADFASRDSKKAKIDNLPPLKINYSNGNNRNSQVLLDQPSPMDFKTRNFNDLKNDMVAKRETVTPNNGAKDYESNKHNSPTAYLNPLQNSSDSQDQQKRSPFICNRLNSVLEEETPFANHFNTGDSLLLKKGSSGDNNSMSYSQMNQVNQELDKSLKNGSFDIGKQMALHNLKNTKEQSQSHGQYDLQMSLSDSGSGTHTQSQQTLEEFSPTSFMNKKPQISNASNQTIGQSLTDRQASNVIKSSKLEILDLTNVFSRINSKSELIYKLTMMFKKILVYSSKLECVKSELFNGNSKFNILEIFKLYDDDKKGHIDLVDFSSFITDVGIQVADPQCRKILQYIHFVIWPDGNDSDTLSLLQFANLFIPFNNDNRFIVKQMFEMYEKKKNVAEDEDTQPTIQESDFHLMRQILIFLMRKIEDLTLVVQSLSEYKVEEAFFAITKGEKKDITWKILSDFLEQNEVRFIDEDLIHIFRDFKSKNMGTISFQNFSDFLNLNIWLN